MDIHFDFNKIQTHFFPNQTCDDLWKKRSLFGAMKDYNTQTISRQDARNLLAKQSFVYVFPDPLPALHLGMDPVGKVVTTQELIAGCAYWYLHNSCSDESILALCPLFVAASDYSWLVALNVGDAFDTTCILFRSTVEVPIDDLPSILEINGSSNFAIVHNAIENFYKNHSGTDLMKNCPNQMLWESPCYDYVETQIFSPEEVVRELARHEDLFVFPEPIPALFMGLKPLCRRISGPELAKNSGQWVTAPGLRRNCLLEIEPLYVVDLDCSWIICLTTENTSAGGTWCIQLKRKRNIPLS